MEFYRLDKEFIKRNSELIGASYKYIIGNKIEVTSIKKKNSNYLLSECLSSSKKEDRLMIKYYPSNVLFFDKDFIESDGSSNSVSCYIDKDGFSVHIGEQDKYPIKTGVLSFSGILSANSLVESNRCIYSTTQFSSKDTHSKVKVLSVGVVGESLLGLFYLPKERGLAISADESVDLSYSVKTWKLMDYSKWSKSTLADWFSGSKIVQL